MKQFNWKEFAINNIVPIIFIVLCIACLPIAGYSGKYLVSQIITRIMRNSFLVLSLLIPIMAGMGLNFGMTLGAMAGQIGIIFITAWNVVSIPGLLLAAIIATPIAVLLGWFCGKMLNMARGREMITSYMISFFMNGVYQLALWDGTCHPALIRSGDTPTRLRREEHDRPSECPQEHRQFLVHQAVR